MLRIKLALVLFVSSVILSILIALLHQFGYFERTNVAITDFRICTSNILSSDANQNASCSYSFPKETQIIYACGSINTHLQPGKFVSLRMYLYGDKIERPIYENSIDDEFTEGIFCRKIPIPIDSQSSSYSVKVYYFRDNIASSEFLIK